jgi:hypothetical protein
MAREFPNAKTKTDEVNSLSIFWLNQQGLLDGLRFALVTFPTGGQAHITTDTRIEKTPCIELSFTVKVGNSKKLHKQTFILDTTPCNFDYSRYWFACSCSRRVGFLYEVNGVFACRICHNLTYASQNKTRYPKSKLGIYREYFDLHSNAKGLSERIITPMYAGRLTRRYDQLMGIKSRMCELDEKLKTLAKPMINK